MSAAKPDRREESLPAEVLALWGLLAVFVLVIFITYTRLDSTDLYNVSHDGVAGGLSRSIVILGYPVAFAVIALVGTLFASLREGVSPLARRLWRWIALLSVLFCATAAFPGVVDQGDLDVKPVNVLAAIGVGGAILLTALSIRERPDVAWSGSWSAWDWARLALGVPMVLLSLPWLAAELGYGSDETSLLTGPFLDFDARDSAATGTVAVHAGDHHGTDGLLLTITVLLLSRPVFALARTRLRSLLILYLCLGFFYGLINVVQDWWLEQLVKRDTLNWEFTNMVEPKPNWEWVVLMLGSIALAAAIHGYERLAVSTWHSRLNVGRAKP